MSDGYQWCPRCCAHIKAQALYCRVCKSNIEEEKKGAFSGVITPGEQLRQASQWFVDYDALVSMMPDSLYKEQMHKALDQRNRHYGLPLPGEHTGEALTLEPLPSVFALMLELFIEARKAGLAIDSIIDTPELRVLGLTAQTVKVEYERVLAELADPRTCLFCAETIARSATACRYCGSDLKSPPQKQKRSIAAGVRKAMLGNVDQNYRRRAITFLAARQARDDPDWKVTLAEVLANNGISEEDIETGMKESAYHALEGLSGLDLPLKDWLIRLTREGLLQDPHYNAALNETGHLQANVH